MDDFSVAQTGFQPRSLEAATLLKLDQLPVDTGNHSNLPVCGKRVIVPEVVNEHITNSDGVLNPLVVVERTTDYHLQHGGPPDRAI
jgi:hypothetical protein